MFQWTRNGRLLLGDFAKLSKFLWCSVTKFWRK